jgi:RimJ/RimL family protein N-acetyltransferase
MKDGEQNQIGFLRKVVQQDLDDISLLKLLADNRNIYLGHFFTQSQSTVETTREFLRSFIDANARFLYLIFVLDNVSRLPILQGHLGYEIVNTESIEVINVMKISGRKLHMEIALNSLLLFLRDSRESQRIFLRVLKENARAISLYKKCGFVEVFDEIDDLRMAMELRF